MPKGNKAIRKQHLMAGYRDYTQDETGNWIEYDKDTDNPDSDILNLNTTQGYYFRNELGPPAYSIDASSNPIANEAGWIAEYWFQKSIIPIYFSSENITPTEYNSRWDFISSETAIEIKTTVPDYENYDRPTFMCPLSKFKKRPYRDSYFIFWCVIDSFDDLIVNRKSIPRNWKFIGLDADLVNPETGSDELFGGFTKKKSSKGNPTYYLDNKFYFTIYKREGELQLIFNESILNDVDFN
jgi:hypothetical protein